MLPFSESTIRSLVIVGRFPKPYKLGAASLGSRPTWRLLSLVRRPAWWGSRRVKQENPGVRAHGYGLES